MEPVTVIDLILIFYGGIPLVPIINCWMMRQSLRAIEEQLNRTSETLQLEIHAIRDVMEEATQKRTES